MPRQVFDLQNVLRLGGLLCVNWLWESYMDESNLGSGKEIVTLCYSGFSLCTLVLSYCLFPPEIPWAFWSLRRLLNTRARLSIPSQCTCSLLPLLSHAFCVKLWFCMSQRSYWASLSSCPLGLKQSPSLIYYVSTCDRQIQSQVLYLLVLSQCHNRCRWLPQSLVSLWSD